MLLTVNVTNAIWREGCADTKEHTHPPEFNAVVDIPEYEWMDDDEVIIAIHDALVTQCDCCVRECDISVTSVTEYDENYERPKQGEEEEEEELED